MANNKSNQRKIFSFVEFNLINALIKDEGNTTGTNESAIVERIILEHYLNVDPFLCDTITNVLYSEDNGLTNAAYRIFNEYARLQVYHDENMLSLVSFIFRLELAHPTDLNSCNYDIHVFMKYLDIIAIVLRSCLNTVEHNTADSLDRTIKVYPLDIKDTINELSELTDKYKAKNKQYPTAAIGRILSAICRYWNLILTDGGFFHDHAVIFRWLAELVNYPPTKVSGLVTIR